MNIGELSLPKGAFLAPMAGVTDMPFRLLCHERGSAFAYTEMISAKGLHYSKNSRANRILQTAVQEGPVGVQLFGSEPKYMYDAVKYVLDLGFALVDINMGCPAPKIVSNGEGCALMLKPLIAAKVIEYAIKAAQCYHNVPVTIKIRKGWEEENYIPFAKMAEASGAAAVTLHARTKNQLYSGKADLSAIAALKAAVSIPVIGNGDVFTHEQVNIMLVETGCDAVMIGRGALGNPWIFSDRLPTPRQRAETALRHAHMLAMVIDERPAVREMRKHVSWYIKGIRGSAMLRQQINAAESLSALSAILEHIKYA